jgi:hypothetical protein
MMDDIALGLCDCLARSIDLSTSTPILRVASSTSAAFRQGQHRGIFGSRSDVNELRRLLAETDAHAIDENELCAAVADCLTNLFAAERLQLFRLAAN